MTTLGLGALLAVVAVLIFIASAVVSVFFGKPMDFDNLTEGMAGVPQGLVKLPPQVHEGEAVAQAHAGGTPGTVILVMVFLVVFVLYYFTNWKILSMIWQIG